MLAAAVIVTTHAAQRYRERLAPHLTIEQAEAAILSHERVIRIAAAFGCSTIRLGNGGKLVIEGLTVVTVLTPKWASRACMTPLRAA